MEQYIVRLESELRWQTDVVNIDLESKLTDALSKLYRVSQILNNIQNTTDYYHDEDFDYVLEDAFGFYNHLKHYIKQETTYNDNDELPF